MALVEVQKTTVSGWVIESGTIGVGSNIFGDRPSANFNNTYEVVHVEAGLQVPSAEDMTLEVGIDRLDTNTSGNYTGVRFGMFNTQLSGTLHWTAFGKLA